MTPGERAEQAGHARSRLAALTALRIGLDRYQEVTEVIAGSADRSAAVLALQERLLVDELGACVILETQWGRLTRDTKQRVLDELAEIEHDLRNLDS